MTAPRIVVPGATTALTRRTTLRKAYLAPWHPMVAQIWFYALADAQRNTGMTVHHSTLVINHHHTSVTPTRDNLPEFLYRLHRDVSSALHTLLCHERYDSPRELFDGRPTHTMRLMDAEAQATHLAYEFLNPVAAGLVAHTEHMPYPVLSFGRWRSGPLVIKRPQFYFGQNRPEELELELTPPPELLRMFGGDTSRLIYHMEQLAEHGRRALRSHRVRPPMGAKGVRRLHPWSEPKTLREAGGTSVPSFRVGAAGILARRLRVEHAREVRLFRGAHKTARLARRDGKTETPFPYGTYAMRVIHGAPVEPQCAEDACVAKPGILLDEVLATTSGADALEEDRLRRERHDAFAKAQIALQGEAEEILATTAMEFVETGTARRDSGTGDDEEAADSTDDRPSPEAVHRFSRFPENGPNAPARLIIHRDRRRGRHGSDPPA